MRQNKSQVHGLNFALRRQKRTDEEDPTHMQGHAGHYTTIHKELQGIVVETITLSAISVDPMDENVVSWVGGCSQD